ncbi:hypothetical protein BN7_1540 [Wickerhamomyces ciferrii]|uniref:F-box domain-containing protein n=1 Tax=Wickerhamomyces ciferrii (strain ATCC 14091 / BCRC 22168 / CBS 111 / JCM 3599 / NBRC 0793 / NRRL Y-1031 F-60-10) TaxID=1206466 RepID=K0KGB1_WICCF|nr:uncharacterized protein BN7_1540 [Wickerhamomyces ciferrii]CCH42001.1 hypothetical protein BN7_1540 [Wickerhamomyces ciferrii]
MLHKLADSLVTDILSFLPQSDILSTLQVSRRLYDLSITKLYKRICIRKDPVYHTDEWFIDSKWTTVSGYRSSHRREDQNDYIIYLKLERLIETLQNTKHSLLIKEVSILGDVFHYKEGEEVLRRFIFTLSERAKCIEILDANSDLVDISKFPNLTRVVTDNVNKLQNTSRLKSLVIDLPGNIDETLIKTNPNFTNLRELVLEDEEFAALRILKIFSESKIPKLSLKRLTFNHVHGLHNYSTVLRELTIKFIEECVDLSNLEELEMSIGCEVQNCDCLDTFLDDLAPMLNSIKKLSLKETTFHRDHYISEKWDININRFLLHLPKGLKYLSIRHNPPRDGKLENNVEGNYIRRKTLYQKVLPTLTSLETVICPTLLQTCACYEILVSDLLWNGCECSYCKDVLGLFDEYLMNHQYYDEEDTEFKDVISPRFFGIAGVELLARLQNKSDLDVLSYAPGQNYWDFHGYETIEHFNDYECMFDESFFEPLAVCVSHFYKGYLEFFVDNLPNLKTVVLSGSHFIVDKHENFRCVYDNPKLI